MAPVLPGRPPPVLWIGPAEASGELALARAWIAERADVLDAVSPATAVANPPESIRDRSPAAVLLQVPRVAGSRGLDEDAVRRLVDEHVEPPLFGVFGRPRVNVLQLNLALEAIARAPGSP